MMNVLLIDDDESITNLFEKYLTRIGYNVVATNNGGDGLYNFNNGHNFDVVITDIDMPGLNGNDVARLIRESKKKTIPIIAITGSDMLDIQYDLFNEVLTKPVRLQTLSEMIYNYGSGGDYVSGKYNQVN